jgi:energy-coupling factor transport system permease protein
MDVYLYLDRATPVHRLDPRAKMLFLLASFVLALSLAELPSLAVLLGLVLAHGGAARSLSNLRRIWVVLVMVAVMSVVIWGLVGRGGNPIFWRVTSDALLFGATTAVRLDTMIFLRHDFLVDDPQRRDNSGVVAPRPAL